MKSFKPSSYEIRAIDLLDESGLLSSRSEGRRLIKQGGFYISKFDNETGEYKGYERISDFNEVIKLEGWEVLKAGKRKFARVSLKKSIKADLNMVVVETGDENDIVKLQVEGKILFIKGAKLCYEIDDDGNIIEQDTDDIEFVPMEDENVR